MQDGRLQLNQVCTILLRPIPLGAFSWVNLSLLLRIPVLLTSQQKKTHRVERKYFGVEESQKLKE
jgi:hypothetical protein